MENKNFTITNGHEKEYSVDELKFILSSADKLLKQSFDSSTTIVTRTVIILSVFVTIFSAAGGYITNQIHSDQMDIPAFCTAIFLSVYILWLFPDVIKNITEYKYYSPGSQPKDYLINYYITKVEDSTEPQNPDYKRREREMLLTEIDSYQDRIDNNNKRNDERWKIYHATMNNIILLPFACVGVYVVTAIISCCNAA